MIQVWMDFMLMNYNGLSHLNGKFQKTKNMRYIIFIKSEQYKEIKTQKYNLYANTTRSNIKPKNQITQLTRRLTLIYYTERGFPYLINRKNNQNTALMT